MYLAEDFLVIRGDAARIPLLDRSVDLCVGSPPYADCRLYLEDGRDLGISRGPADWIDWMLCVTAEALRVTAGPVIWVASGPTRDRDYWPICEGLAYRWWAEGWGERGPGTYASGSMYRPVFWYRPGVPGSGNDQWFRTDVEFCLCFKRPGPLPWSDNTACGHPPRWAPGGEMYRCATDGDRRNQWGRHMNCTRSYRKADGSFQPAFRPSHYHPSARLADGSVQVSNDVPPVLANPGTLLVTNSVANSMIVKRGSAMTSSNEAPFPVEVPAFFIASLCPPGGLILDPFSGGGTTCEAAVALGRRAIGMDLRQSQCRIASRRLQRPHMPVARSAGPERPLPLFDAASTADSAVSMPIPGYNVATREPESETIDS